MPSSRATMPAGTRPPRVMPTIAANGPDALRRQASARESRWNWSHETGNIFAGATSSLIATSGGNESGPTALPRRLLAHIQHEIEAPVATVTVAGFRHLHQKLAPEQA